MEAGTRTIHNFNAGPSILPREVFEEASRAIIDFNDTGLSILEIGHRTPLFQPVMDEARALVRELMELDEEHEVLFLHGGATTQFMQVPMNLLNEDELAAYTDTGTWSGKAIREGRLFGHIEIAGSSAADQYRGIPKDLTVTPTAAYLHMTTNETIGGIQWQEIPWQPDVPLVADMSSDILSRVLDFNRFGLIYAGAQKNLGASGVNLVVVNRHLLGQVRRNIPTILDYRNHIREGSMLNTPPVFSIYVVLLNLRWLKAQGGVKAIEERNQAKSFLLYETIDRLPLFHSPVSKEDRSRMNVVFTIADPKLESSFLELCHKEGMIGVKGHRSVGGFRISLYNALPLESVRAITALMNYFAAKKG